MEKVLPGSNGAVLNLRCSPEAELAAALCAGLGVMQIEVDLLPMAKPFSNEPFEVPPWSGALVQSLRRPSVVFTQGHDLGPQRPGDCF